MDPTPEQLRSLDTLGRLLDFAGLDQPLRGTTLEALGHPTSVREISFVSQGDLEEVLTTLRVPGPVSEDGGPSGPSVQASPIQKGVVRFLLRVARLRAGLPVEGASPQPASGPAPSVGGLSQPTKRVKLSSLVDSAAEAELVTLEGSEIRRLFGEYKRVRGDYPHKDMEPSEDQLSAVAQLLKTGQAPYVDFSLFGPQGKRALRKLTLMSFTFQVETGTWKRVELPGPPDFNTWWKSWLVLKTALLLLQCVDAERLEHYGEFIRQLVDMYGPESWFLIYQADVRFRSEEMERIRRSAQIAHEDNASEANPRAGYSPDRPWDWVWAAALGDAGRGFWESEVHRPAVFFLARIKSRNETVQDGTTILNGQAPSAGGADGGAPKRVPPKKRPKKERPPKAPGAPPGPKPPKKEYDVSRNASEVCQNFSRGKCTDPCPHGRIHQAGAPPDGGKGAPAKKQQ